jgi:hypothetical protein
MDNSYSIAAPAIPCNRRSSLKSVQGAMNEQGWVVKPTVDAPTTCNNLIDQGFAVARSQALMRHPMNPDVQRHRPKFMIPNQSSYRMNFV